MSYEYIYGYVDPKMTTHRNALKILIKLIKNDIAEISDIKIDACFLWVAENTLKIQQDVELNIINNCSDINWRLDGLAATAFNDTIKAINRRIEYLWFDKPHITKTLIDCSALLAYDVIKHKHAKQILKCGLGRNK